MTMVGGQYVDPYVEYQFTNNVMRVAETRDRAVVPTIAPVQGAPLQSMQLMITDGTQPVPISEGEIFYRKKHCNQYCQWWLLFGLCGAHRFYLSSECKYLGLFYLLTFGGFGIGWIVDMCLCCHLVNKRNHDKSPGGGCCGKPRQHRNPPFTLGEPVKSYEIRGSRANPKAVPARPPLQKHAYSCAEAEILFTDGDDGLLPKLYQEKWRQAVSAFERHIPALERIVAECSTDAQSGTCCTYKSQGWVHAHSALQQRWVPRVNEDLWPLGFTCNTEHSTDMVQVKGIWSLCPCFRHNLRVFICLSMPCVPHAGMNDTKAVTFPVAQVVGGASSPKRASVTPTN